MKKDEEGRQHDSQMAILDKTETSQARCVLVDNRQPTLCMRANMLMMYPMQLAAAMKG